MAPASADARDVAMEGLEDGKLCKQCLERGERNALRCLQINNDVAVFVCDSDKCTTLPTLAPGSQLVIERRATDLNYLRKRKKRVTGLPAANCPAKSSTAQRVTSTLASTPSPGSPEKLGTPSEKRLSFLPKHGIIQWPNEDRLCWLDISMLLLVAFGSLRQCHRKLSGTSLLKQLCNGFDEAQRIVAGTLDSSQSNKEISVNQSNNHPMGKSTDTPSDALPFCAENSLMGDGLSQDFLDYLLEDKDQQRNVNGTGLTITNSHGAIHASNSSEQNAASTTDIGTAVELLRKKRQELFSTLQPKLRCEEGKADSPVMALPLLLRLDGPTEEHFASRYRREFYCFACGFTSVTIHRNVVVSLSSTTGDFTMNHPTIRHACPQCSAPGQTSRIVYHSMPACPLVHLISGLDTGEGGAWLPQLRSYKHQGTSYQLTCVIQYKRNPDHFVAWIRDPAREMWLECNDLSSPVCHWRSDKPPIPPSEVHILGWEREAGDCQACLSLQEEIMEIEDAPVSAEVDAAAGSMHRAEMGATKLVAPVRKKSCPVMPQRSASPLAIPREKSIPSLAARNPPVAITRNTSIATSARNRPMPSSHSYPGASLLSIGTPPQSPEFCTASDAVSVDAIASRLGPSLEDSGKSESKDVSSQLKLSLASRKAHMSGISSRGRDTSSTLRKVDQASEKRKRCSSFSIFGEIPKNIMNRHGGMKESPLPLPAMMESKPHTSQTYSVSKMLRSLNSNNPLKTMRKKEEESGETTCSTTPVPQMIKRVRLPKRKYESFSAFKEVSGRFSGYMKPGSTKKSGTFSGYKTKRSVKIEQSPMKSGSQANFDGDQVDLYNSNILLTPSSSVSSPSACSENSFQNENAFLPGAMDQTESPINPTDDDLSNTMDALCKALDITSTEIPQEAAPSSSSSHLSNFLDDCNFLEGLLR